jgi:hypothetical protein
MTPTTFTSGVQASLEPWNDEAGAWQAMTAALAAMFEQAFGVVADQGSPDQPATYTAGWSNLLNPTTCPTAYLPYLSLYNGTNVAPGTDDADARSIIKAESGFSRGTPASIVAAAQRNLSGTQSCILLERTPDPYQITLVMRPEQVINQTALQNAVLATKPAGILCNFVYSDGWIINQMEGAYATITLLEAAFATITGLEGDQVGH